MSDILLEMKGITKSFPGVLALDKVDLTVRKGTVHSLMGENGAGKSTLMKILSGVYRKDAGSILFDGEELDIVNARYALDKGISMIFQEISDIPQMTVAENIYVGREPLQRNRVLISKRKMTADAAALLARLNIEGIEPHQKVSQLSVAKKQMVEIAKAISYDSKLIIMDEPTSSLTEVECAHLFEIVKNLKQKGVTFIFISHKLEEIFSIADEVTVMRDGKLIDTRSIADIDQETLITLMVGREIKNLYPARRTESGGETVLKVEGLTAPGVFEDVSFEIRKGEVVGFSGLVGAGRSEVMEAVFGWRPYESGTIYINGAKARIRSPKDAIRHSMAFLTEDRRAYGILPPLDLVDNIILPSIHKYIARTRFLKRKAMRRATEAQMARYAVKAPGPDALIRNLSGGNQQKVLLARWMMTEPNLLILDEPTRGIDVGAKAEIYQYIDQLRASGKSIIMVSSELPEILGMSNRVYVMCEHRIAGEVGMEEMDQETIMKYATGLKIQNTRKEVV